MKFEFGTKLRLKKDWEKGYLTFQECDIVNVAHHDHKYGITLAHTQVRGTFDFNHSPENARAKIEEYFEVVESYDDRLAELEAVILDHYLKKGYKLEKDQVDGDVQWAFNVTIMTDHKCKILKVRFFAGAGFEEVYLIEKDTTKEMFDVAIAHFSGRDDGKS